MRKHHRQLDTSVGASGPHDFAVRIGVARLATQTRPSQPAPTSVTWPTPPLAGQDRRITPVICAEKNENIFLTPYWTARPNHRRIEKIFAGRRMGRAKRNPSLRLPTPASIRPSSRVI